MELLTINDIEAMEWAGILEVISKGSKVYTVKYYNKKGIKTVQLWE